MVEIYGIECNTAADVIEEISSSLSGTCMNSVEQCFDDEEYQKGIKAFGVTEDDVYDYLATEGIFQCDSCGWWTYSGEGDGTDCDECLNAKEEEEDD